MHDGVLSLVVPRPERMVPRTIAVGTGSEAEREGRQLEASTT
jgi:hypothetical protein